MPFWKIAASKLQRKTRKLNTPNQQPIGKPNKSRFSSVQSKKFKHKKKLPKTFVYHHRHHHSQRNPSSPAVYVDQHSINPVSGSGIEEDDAHPSSSVTTSAVNKKVTTPSSSSANKDEEDINGVTADQDSVDCMWESMVLASPELNQINERADEFIARFREKLARRL